MFLLPSLVFALSTAVQPASPHSNLVIAPCDGGDRQQFEVFKCDIPMTNTGDRPIRIFNGKAVNPADSMDGGTVVVPPHGTAYVWSQVSVQDRVGFMKRAFRFSTDEPGPLALRASNVMAFVSTVLDEKSPIMDFGPVNLGGELPTKSIALSSREVRDFRVVEVLAKPDYLDVSLDAETGVVRASVKPNAPLGLRHDKIKLKINATQQPEAWIGVEANFEGSVRPDGNPFSLGLMRTNSKNEFLIRLSSTKGDDFKVGTLALVGVRGKASIAPCSPKQTGCKLVRLTIGQDQAIGRVDGVLNIELPNEKRTLPVELVGMLLSPDTTVHDINREIEKAREQKGNAKSEVVAAGDGTNNVDIGRALAHTTDKNHQTPPPGNGPLLAWSVENEGVIHGYIIYRADAEKGPFLRINKDLIKVVDGGTNFGSYQWRDNSAKSGSTYWYSIGIVKSDGEKQPLTGAQMMVAK